VNIHVLCKSVHNNSQSITHCVFKRSITLFGAKHQLWRQWITTQPNHLYHKCVGKSKETRIKNGSAVVPDKITRTVNLTGYDTHVTWTCGSVKPCCSLTSRRSGLEDNWHVYSSLADILLHNYYSAYTRPSEVQSAAVLVIICHNGDYFSTNFMYRKTLKIRKRNISDTFAIYGRGRELFRPLTYICPSGSQEIIHLLCTPKVNNCFSLTFSLLMGRIGRAPKSILIYSYIQQDATLHNLFISGNSSTCFGWYFHPSSGAHTTVSTASGICHSTLKPVPTLPR
jgi:hypothetical protein